MRPQSIKKYDIAFAKQDDGTEVRRRFILSFDRPIKDEVMMGRINNVLGQQVAGIDVFKILGRYSAEVLIAQTFDPDDVIEVLKEELDIVLSEIIQPSKDVIKPVIAT